MSTHRWTLEEAIAVINSVEPTLKLKCNIFLGLCGGVLRNGWSDKDLDLVLLPMNSDNPADFDRALSILDSAWGNRKKDSISTTGQAYQPLRFYQYKDKQIDVIRVV